MTGFYPRKHPLSSAEAKVSRAHEHIKALISSISTLTKSDVVITRKYSERDGLRTGLVVDVLDIAARDPVPWALIIGDVATNLRSAVDHVAWALALLHSNETGIALTPSQQRRITFPLHVDHAPHPFRLGAGLSKSSLAFFPDYTWDTVDAFQPCHQTDRPELELFGILDELARWDKHRVINIPRRRLQLKIAEGDTRVFNQSLDERRHQWIYSGPERENFQPNGTFDIFTYPSLRGKRGFSTFELRDVHKVIRDDLLPAFARFFE